MRTSLVLCLLLASFARAETTWRGACDISFDALATMHDFKGHVKSEPFDVRVAGDRMTWRTDVSPFKISTDEKDRDAEVQRTLKADSFKLMSGAATDVAIAGLRGDEAELPFDLSIAGVTRSKRGVITGFKDEPDALSFNVSFDVSMKDFGLKPKSLLGLIRVNDRVRVTCRFVFSKSSS